MMMKVSSCSSYCWVYSICFSCIIAMVYTDQCNSHLTCSQCLKTSDCAWCITNTTAQCVLPDDDSSLTCLSLINPRSSIRDQVNQELEGINQISLRNIDLSLRVGEPVTFNFTVKAAENYPLDLYILMDLSYTYANDLVQVKMLAPSLANSLQNLSTDSLIGFGTFVDKQSPPFASRRQLDLSFTDKKGNSSCRNNDNCSLPIAYEHVSDLTNSSEIFNDAIQQLIISTSADGPEGTLDGMMQVAVCTELVGWRENSRKVMMVMTDDVVHSAGDGRVAGITRINDAQCHTEYNEQYNKFLYSASTKYDYPSFEQLRLVLRREAIVPVFAIPTTINNLEDYFEKVKNALNGFLAVSAGTDSSDLIEVIAEAYNDVVSQVSVDYDSPSFIQSSVQFTCPPTDNATISNERCTDIGGNEVQVSMTLTLSECVPEISNGERYSFEVNIPGFDKFTVNVKGECSCDCDDVTETNVTQCANGELKCSKCYCNEGWKGDKCDCSLMACPSFNGQECGGRGTCDGCGNCECNVIDRPVGGVASPIIFGDSCECSNYDCESDSIGRVCSGRGTCECDGGVFMCNCSMSIISNNVHYGDLCQCSYDHCIDPENVNNGICSGHGSCVKPCDGQGKGCSCNDSYIGNYCQTFVDKITDNCGRGDEDCIKCYGEAAEDGKDSSSCDNCNGQYTILYEAQSSSYEIPDAIPDTTQECSLSTTECNYVYFVGSTISGDLVYAVEPRACLPIPIWGIALIVVGLLLIVGLGILVGIKLFIMWLDHREYKHFMYDIKQAGLASQNNPVYQTPVTHVDNPILLKDDYEYEQEERIEKEYNVVENVSYRKVTHEESNVNHDYHEILEL